MPYKDKAAAAANNKKYRQENMIKMIEFLETHHCVDCGNSNPIVLEFDHLPEFEKKFEVGRAVTGSTRSWTLILEEIAKCEVVCANCHKIRTATRANTYRFASVSPPTSNRSLTA